MAAEGRDSDSDSDSDSNKETKRQKRQEIAPKKERGESIALHKTYQLYAVADTKPLTIGSDEGVERAVKVLKHFISTACKASLHDLFATFGLDRVS